MLEKWQKHPKNMLEKWQELVNNALEKWHNKEYGIADALVLNNENIQQKGNVLYAPIYMTMFVEKKRVVGETKYVLDMEGLR